LQASLKIEAAKHEGNIRLLKECAASSKALDQLLLDLLRLGLDHLRRVLEHVEHREQTAMLLLQMADVRTRNRRLRLVEG